MKVTSPLHYSMFATVLVIIMLRSKAVGGPFKRTCSNIQLSIGLLNVDNCGTETVENWKDVFSTKSIYLHRNQPTAFPRSFATLNISIKQLLSLYNNRLRCVCDDKWTENCQNLVSQHLVYREDLSCASPSRLRGKGRNSDEELCVDPVQITLIIVLSSTTSVVVLLSVGVIVYRLRVKIYTGQTEYFHPLDRDECLEEDMDYDVFLSCSSRDNLPHGNGLRMDLEERGYRVCYPPRDFVAGQTIVDNIYRAIAHSKRTVCLLTTNFLERLNQLYVSLNWIMNLSSFRT